MPPRRKDTNPSLFRSFFMSQRHLLVVQSLLIFVCGVASAADRPVIDVWPGKVPGETKEIGPEELRPPQPKQRADVQRLTNVSKPTLTLFQAPEGKRNGAAVVIC